MSDAATVPRLGPDSTLALLLEGYEFVRTRCRRLDSDLFETRLACVPIVCMTGPEAAQVVYDGERTTRRRALPRPTLTLLQDFGSVQGLDGAAHAHRKAMFLECMVRERLEDLRATAAERWDAATRRWPTDGASVDEEAQRILCRTVCTWAGVPLPETEVAERARDLGLLFDGAGSQGPRQVRGQLARRRCERWAQEIVRGVRDGALRPQEGTAAAVIARHRGLDDEPLPVEVAGVELLNVLRPTVAVSRFVTFAALALHTHPRWQEAVADDEEACHRFVQEVRRTAPFFPAVTARVARPFTFAGRPFSPGEWVLLDIYGTNRDPRSWDDPDRFDPDRFAGREPTPFDLVPQGAGAFETGHRCAGEWATIALLEVAVAALARLGGRLPHQDLTVDLRRLPARPRSGVVVEPAPGRSVSRPLHRASIAR